MRRRSAFACFIVLSVLGLGLNSLCMWLIVDGAGIDYRAAKVLAALIVSVWNFVTRKLFLEEHSGRMWARLGERLAAFCATHASAAESRALSFVRDVLDVYEDVRSMRTACRLVRVERRRAL